MFLIAYFFYSVRLVCLFDTNICKYNSNTISYEILTFNCVSEYELYDILTFSNYLALYKQDEYGKIHNRSRSNK